MQNQVIHKLSVDESLEIADFYLSGRRIYKDWEAITMSKFQVNLYQLSQCQQVAYNHGLTNETTGAN